MQQGSGFLLIVAGLLILFIVISGKLGLFENFIYQLFNLTPPGTAATAGTNAAPNAAPGDAPAAKGPQSLPYGLTLPTLGDVPSIDQIFGRQQ